MRKYLLCPPFFYQLRRPKTNPSPLSPQKARLSPGSTRPTFEEAQSFKELARTTRSTQIAIDTLHALGSTDPPRPSANILPPLPLPKKSPISAKPSANPLFLRRGGYRPRLHIVVQAKEAARQLRGTARCPCLIMPFLGLITPSRGGKSRSIAQLYALTSASWCAVIVW